MGGFGTALSDLAKKAGIGGTTLQTIQTLEQHPEYLALGAALPAAAGLNALFPGMALDRPGMGIVQAISHPFGRGNSLIKPPVQIGSPGPVFAPAAIAQGLGTQYQGVQPFSTAGYFELAASSNVTAKAAIFDGFATAVNPDLTAADTFPWPFQAYAMRWLLVTQPQAAGKEDLAWQETLHVVFSVATEIARINLESLGLRTAVVGITTSGAAANMIEKQPPCAWTVFYEKNGTYVMQVMTSVGVTGTSGNMSWGYALDGWVINDTVGGNMGTPAIISAVEGLLRQHASITDEAQLKSSALAAANANPYDLANFAYQGAH